MTKCSSRAHASAAASYFVGVSSSVRGRDQIVGGRWCDDLRHADRDLVAVAGIAARAGGGITSAVQAGVTQRRAGTPQPGVPRARRDLGDALMTAAPQVPWPAPARPARPARPAPDWAVSRSPRGEESEIHPRIYIHP